MAKTNKLGLCFLIQLLVLMSVCILSVKCGHENFLFKQKSDLEINTAVQRFMSIIKNFKRPTNFKLELHRLNANTLINSENVTESCLIQMKNLIDGLKNSSEWALSGRYTNFNNQLYLVKFIFKFQIT